MVQVLPSLLLNEPWGVAGSPDEGRRLDLLFLMSDSRCVREHTLHRWWHVYAPGAYSRPLGFGLLGFRPNASWVLTTLVSIVFSFMLGPLKTMTHHVISNSP